MLDAEIEVAGVRWSWKMQVCSECTRLLCLHEPVQNAIWLCQLAAFLCVLTEELKCYTFCNTLNIVDSNSDQNVSVSVTRH